MTAQATPFEALDYDTQVKHLTQLARRAAAHFGLLRAPVKLLAYTNNAVFQLDDQDAYILRVHRPGGKSLARIQSERAWLLALARESSLLVPEPVGPVYEGTLTGFKGTVYCTLSRKVPGETRTLRQMTTANLEAIGRFTAELHRVSAAFTPPPGFERPRLDYAGLFGAGGPYDPGEVGMALFTEEQQAIIDKVTARVKASMEALGETDETFGLIHGDLIAKNLLFSDSGRVGAVDFEECAFGYFLYDLTPMIWLARSTSYASKVRKSLWKGYNAVRPLPASHAKHLEVFVAARHVASCRWVAGNASHPKLRGKAEEVITTRVEEMQGFLERGSM